MEKRDHCLIVFAVDANCYSTAVAGSCNIKQQYVGVLMESFVAAAVLHT